MISGGQVLGRAKSKTLILQPNPGQSALTDRIESDRNYICSNVLAQSSPLRFPPSVRDPQAGQRNAVIEELAKVVPLERLCARRKPC